MRRHYHRREHLRCSDIRTAKHPDFSVRLLQLCSPLNRVETIGALIAKWIKLSTRCKATTRVLQNDDITMRRQLVRESWIAGPVVRCACQENRKLLVTHRAIDIRYKRHTVSHLHADTGLNFDPVGCLRTDTRRSEGQT